MKNKKYILSALVILLTGIFYFAVQAQQNKITQRANFSGEWISKESISMGGNIVCSYDEGDRMLSKKMIVSQQDDYLTIDISNSSPGTSINSSPEKLRLDGKENQFIAGNEKRKKSTVTFSADGKTMTIKTIVNLMVATPYNVHVQKEAFVNVNEIWSLSSDGKSIKVKAYAKSNIFDDERSWITVFDKANK